MNDAGEPRRQRSNARTSGRNLDDGLDDDDDELIGRMADDAQPVPAAWRGRIRVLWAAHQDRVQRQQIAAEWRRGAIQVLTTTAGLLGAAKLGWELWKQWNP